MLVVDHGIPFEAAATGNMSILAIDTKAARDVPCNCGEIDALRVGFDGRAIGTPFRIASSFALRTQPAAAFDGVRFLVAWNELADPPLTNVPKPPRLVGAFVSEDGTTSAPFTIAAAKEIRPVIVWDGTQYLVFYNDPDGHAMAVHVTDQGIVGTPLNLGNDEQVLNATAGGSQIAYVSLREKTLSVSILGGSTQELPSGTFQARVAWNERVFLLVWTEQYAVYARTLDGEPHLVANDYWGPARLQLVASGSLFLAAWEGSSIATAWIDPEPFGVLATVDTGFRLQRAPQVPVLADVPGDAVALFYVRFFPIGQFGGFANEYVSLVKPGRQRVRR